MEVTPIAASTALGISEHALPEHYGAQRPLRIHVSSAAKAELAVSTSSIDASPQSGPTDSLANTIDRIRVEFDVLRHRLVEPDSRWSGSRATHQTSPQASQLEAVMNQSMRIQTGVFQMAVSFQAGLTASQQAQSGVKTLVEKS